MQSIKEFNFANIEKKWQKRWEDAKIFEANPDGRKKFFVNFPYPYINSYLHLGHAFSSTRVDVIVPAAKEDFIRMGTSVDWRRSFITTSLNPKYDQFIQWQFKKLKEKGFIDKGKHPVVWCPKDKMPVGDHDRIEGEGETPQEFCLLKFKLDKDYLVVATLRPETVFGQTNLWINPHINYVKIKINGEHWIVSKPCSKKLEMQDKKIEIIKEINGKEFIGKYVIAPGIDKNIIILPAVFVDEDRGTGIVTSVPSDAPYDYIALKELQDSKELDKKYKFTLKQIEEIEDIEIIPIINTKKYGNQAAVRVVEDYKIFSQEDKRLDKLTQEVYKEGYHNGIMLETCSKYKGMKVIEAKDKIKEELKEKGLLDIFYELSGKVICRCLTPCVVNIVSDQWFLKYGDKKWKEIVKKELEQMRLYPELVRPQFNYVINWLNDWACTHLHGTGTKLPWDNKWIIESLSDSTIYMAFYTISHLLEKIPEKEINDELFDYVFLKKGKNNKRLDNLRKEFEYWYPFDVRSSAKDLVQNHLAFCLFNHAAIFPKEYWPKAFSVNGWLLVGGEKMSKSKGNFFTIREILEKYPADALRAGLMLGGEGLDDPNLDFNNTETVNAKLKQWYEFAKGNYKKAKKTQLNKSDMLFLSYINKYLKEGTKAMDEMLFRTAFDRLFFQLQRVLKEYLKRNEINQEVLNDFIILQTKILQPFCPHISEELWEKLGNSPFISLQKWPEADESKISPELEEAEKALEKTIEDIKNILRIVKEKSKKEQKIIYLYVLPNEISNYPIEIISAKLGISVNIFKVNDKSKYDPEDKAKKAKPNKPGIYIE